MNVLEMSAMELISALRSRQLTATTLLQCTIKQAERVSESCNPFAVKLYDRAMQEAKSADRQLDAGTGGTLCGLPVTVKDSQWLAGVPCANGSATQRDFIPEHSSAAIRRLQQAGAIIFAKTTCPEFSLSGITDSAFYGRTSNPWNTQRTCGGSSGGAGVAVSVGAGTLSLGGDGGGSIRIPAAFCGIVGFKPSFRAVPREPCFPSWSTLVSYGPMTRTVSDARLMFSTLVDANHPFHSYEAEKTGYEQVLSLRGKKIIVSEDMGIAPIDEDVRLGFRSTLKHLRAAGAELIYDHPHLPSSVIAWATCAHYDSWLHQKKKADPLKDLQKSTLHLMKFGASLTEGEFGAAEAHRKTIDEAYRAMFERNGTSIFITPTLGCEAFKHGPRHPIYLGSTKISDPWLDWATFLYDANLIGMPACALPMGLGKNQLPISIQVMGPVGSDALVLDISENIETLINWKYRPEDF